MAISSYKVFLMKKTGTGSSATWDKLVDIKDFGDLGGVPEKLETTTLSNKARTYIAGIQSSEPIECTANYDKTDFQTLDALKETSEEYAIWFGGTESGGVVTPTGSEGKAEFTGELSVYVKGAGVNEVVDMGITITPSTDINWNFGS